MNIPPELLGPLGLTVALIIAVVFMARELVRFVREYIAELRAQLTVALAGWQAQTDANRVLAEAQASRNRDDEMRQRLSEANKGPKP